MNANNPQNGNDMSTDFADDGPDIHCSRPAGVSSNSVWQYSM